MFFEPNRILAKGGELWNEERSALEIGKCREAFNTSFNCDKVHSFLIFQ
jgi:hypothetical protein